MSLRSLSWLLLEQATAVTMTPNVQSYPCGDANFDAAQVWAFEDGLLRLQSADSSAGYVALQRPAPIGPEAANAVLDTKANAINFVWNASDGRLWSPEQDMCFVSSDPKARGFLPNVFLEGCSGAETWSMEHDGRVRSSTGQCLDVGSGGSAVGNFSLPMLPAALPEQQALCMDNMSSWGGSVIRADDGTYHMFASVFADGGGLRNWTTMSEIMHAVSDTPEGPFQPREIVQEPFAHNPQVARANDGTYLLFAIQKDAMLLKHADSLDGPWSDVEQPGLVNCNNPAPVTVPGEDTVYLFCHGGPVKNHYGMSVEIVTAPTWRGPWTMFKGNADLYDNGTAIFAHPMEDPNVWVSRDGTWHMLMHGFRMHMLNCTDCGAYAWSKNGPFGPWHFQENLAPYTEDVLFANGTTVTLSGRERPKILLNEDGHPTHLYTGACPAGSAHGGPSDPTGHCFTMVQKIDPSVQLWNHPAAEREVLV